MLTYLQIGIKCILQKQKLGKMNGVSSGDELCQLNRISSSPSFRFGTKHASALIIILIFDI